MNINRIASCAHWMNKFVKVYNPKIRKIFAKNMLGSKYPLNPSMNIQKLKKIIK